MSRITPSRFSSKAAPAVRARSFQEALARSTRHRACRIKVRTLPTTHAPRLFRAPPGGKALLLSRVVERGGRTMIGRLSALDDSLLTLSVSTVPGRGEANHIRGC